MAAFRTQAKVDKAGIADQEALQAEEFVEIQGVLSGLADCLTPALDAVLGWLFALDLEARAEIREQEEGSRPCQDISRDGRDDLLRAGGQISREKSVQDVGRGGVLCVNESRSAAGTLFASRDDRVAVLPPLSKSLDLVGGLLEKHRSRNART
jgi:hypothetical protein